MKTILITLALLFLVALSSAPAQQPSAPPSLRSTCLASCVMGVYSALSSVGLLAEAVKQDRCDRPAAAQLAIQYQTMLVTTSELLQRMRSSGELSRKESDKVAIMITVTQQTAKAAAHVRAYLQSSQPGEGEACDEALAAALRSVQEITPRSRLAGTP